MSTVTIENYKGFEISFDTYNEKFTFSINDDNFSKLSYSACKTKINSYLKENQNFKSFKVRRKSNLNTILEIVGIR